MAAYSFDGNTEDLIIYARYSHKCLSLASGSIQSSTKMKKNMPMFLNSRPLKTEKSRLLPLLGNSFVTFVTDISSLNFWVDESFLFVILGLRSPTLIFL